MSQLGVSVCTLVTAMLSHDTPKQITVYPQITRPVALSRKPLVSTLAQLYGNRLFITETNCKGLGFPSIVLLATV